MNVKSRHHLRADAIDEIESAVADDLGVVIEADSYEKVEFDDSDWEVVLVDGEPLVLYVDSEAQSASERSSAEQSSTDHSSGQRPREDGEAAKQEPFLTVRGLN